MKIGFMPILSENSKHKAQSQILSLSAAEATVSRAYDLFKTFDFADNNLLDFFHGSNLLSHFV